MHVQAGWHVPRFDTDIFLRECGSEGKWMGVIGSELSWK